MRKTVKRKSGARKLSGSKTAAAGISHDAAMVQQLREDPEFAAEYLQAAIESSDEPRLLVLALRRIAEAKGMSAVAAAVGIHRESLYRTLSPKGNPRLSTLLAVVKAMGLAIEVKRAS